MQYEELKKGYDYGLSKIYEMVINNDPCYAYLMRCNHTVDQKLVMAHVYGHCDFFKNNAYFAHTTRKMMDEMANHGARIRRYVERFGEDEVEAFVDRCMSIDDLIDIHSVAITPPRRPVAVRLHARADDEDEERRPTRFKSKDYMDEYINPPRRAARPRRTSATQGARSSRARSFPEQPEKDVLLFLIEHAPLKNWQRDVLVDRPRRGVLLRPAGADEDHERRLGQLLAQHHHDAEGAAPVRGDRLRRPPLRHDGDAAAAGSTRTSSGIELLRDIEQRWNTGRFGTEWDDCDDLEKKRTWDKQARPGPAEDLRGPPGPQRHHLHRHVPDAGVLRASTSCSRSPTRSQTQNYVIESREFEKIKQRLLFSLTNFGKPWIYVVDGNYRNRGELLLRHEYNGVELKLDEARDTLANVQYIWGRPVHLETVVDDKPTLLSFDGTEHTQQVIGDDE